MFYEKADWDWLSLSTSFITIPGSGQAVFNATLAPVDAAPGVYESAIELQSSAGNINIPIVALLASDSNTFDFGGPADMVTPYDNAQMFGGFNWNWRYESGDWRFFYYDFADGTQQAGKSLLVETRWDVPKTDIDTWLLAKPEIPADSLSPDIFGPQGIGVIGGSEDTYRIEGKFGWGTNTGTSRELVGMALQDGLGIIGLHNVLTGGGQPTEAYSGSVFQFSSEPGQATLDLQPENAQAPYLVGSQNLTFTATGDVPEGIQVRAYGFSVPQNLTNQPISQNAPNNFCSSTWIYRQYNGGLKISNGGLLDISTFSANADLDLDIYLFEDNGNGVWNCSQETLTAYSMNSGPEENVEIYFPADGTYWIAAHGYYVPENQKQVFDINIRSAQGADIKLRNLPSGPLFAGHPVQLEVAFQSLYNAKIPSTLEGVLFVGPASVPTLLEIPIRLRPTILLYPRPVMYLSSHWLQGTPQEFRLSFQNHGVQPEDAQVDITFPDGLEYLTGSAIGPGAQPVYDFPSRTLSWSGQAGAGEKIEITFQAAAEPGYPPGKATLHTRVIGDHSEQEWQLGTDVWLNQYAQFLPFLRR